MKSGKITYRVTAVPLSQYDIKYVYPNVEKKKAAHSIFWCFPFRWGVKQYKTAKSRQDYT